MFDVSVSEEQFKYAQSLINGYNFGMRGYGDGNKDEQLTGMIGQTVLSDLLETDRPSGELGFDGGVDFTIEGVKVDLKTMTRKVPMKNHYVHNFIGYQLKYDTEGYIFASYNKTNNVLTICGFVTKAEFIVRAHFYKKGELRVRDDGTAFPTKAPLYEIVQSELHQVNSLEELLKTICDSKK